MNTRSKRPYDRKEIPHEKAPAHGTNWDSQLKPGAVAVSDGVPSGKLPRWSVRTKMSVETRYQTGERYGDSAFRWVV